MNVISFSLWGTDSRLHSGALVNVELARRYYPGWYCVFYLRDDVPRAVGASLEMQGAIVHWKRQTKGDWEGLFWRFEPIYDINIKTTLSRDCDSRLNPREAAAVEEWLRTPRFFHSMRDHYEHNLGIMGGMFGCHYWGGFKAKLEAWTDFGAKGCDQVFLNQVIWPEVRDQYGCA
jgi:protein O-GlcNAc transferase